MGTKARLWVGNALRRAIFAIAAATSAASTALAADLTIGERTLGVPLPRDHCVLTETGPNDVRFAEFVRALQPPGQRVLLITVHCDQLRDYRETAGWFWRVYDFAAYVTLRLTNPSSYAGMSRAEYAAEFAQKVAQELPPDPTNEVERWSAQMKRGAGFRTEIEGRNVLERDATAAYLATFTKLSDGRGVKRYYTATGVTLLLDQPFAVNMHRHADDQKGRSAALQQAKAAVASLVEAERRTLAPAPDRDSPFASLNPTLIAAAAGVLIGAFVLVAGALLLRSRD
jgi:hypothetical protein